MVQDNRANTNKEFLVSPYGVNLSDVEAKLPEILLRLLAPHSEVNEWLMALMANITVAGGLLPEVWTTYAGRRTYPMLMLFVACPPAAGKGVTGFSSKLLERINRHLRENYEGALLTYQQAKDIYKASLKTATPGIPPVRLKRAQLLVPGNITSSKLIQQIADNERMPLVMVETEADVLAGSFKSDHGTSISALIRQAFHHERISLSRKTDDEILEIENPKVAIVLSGTDNQIMSIFKSNQDRLFSRFMFLRNTASIEWRSGRPVIGSTSLDDHYREWSEWFFQIWQQTQEFKAEVIFTDSQWDLIDKDGMAHQGQAHLAGGEYSISIARRHSLMVIRMATIFSFFRRLDADSGVVNTAVSGWVCDDMDVELALTLTSISFQNSLKLFTVMPQTREVQHANGRRIAFFNALPDHCEMPAINDVARTYVISDRTKKRWLQEFCETGLLERVDRGVYKKTAMARVASMALTPNDGQLTDNP